MEEKLEQAYELAKFYETKCTGCAQAVVAAVFEVIGNGSDEVFKSASGLADGIGLTGQGSCGALLGGALAISHYYGRDKEAFENIRRPIKSYMLAKRLFKEFEQKYGYTKCNDIQKSLTGRSFDFWDMKDVREAMSCNLRNQCSKVVGTAAKLTTNIILEIETRK